MPMIEQVIYYSISCDGEDCCELYEDTNGNCEFEDMPEDIDFEEAEWKVEGDNYFCPNCK